MIYGAYGARIDLQMLDVLEKLVAGDDRAEDDLVRKARVPFPPDGEMVAIYPTPNMQPGRSWASAQESHSINDVFDGIDSLIPTLPNLVTALSDVHDVPFAVMACGIDRPYLACRGIPLYLMNHQGTLYWSDDLDALASFCSLGQWPATVRDATVIDLKTGEYVSLIWTPSAVE